MADVSGAPFAPINTGLATPSTYALGRGALHFSELTAADVPDGDGWIHMGNAPSVSSDLSREYLDHFTSLYGVRAQDVKIPISSSFSLRFTLEELNEKNAELYFSGETAAVTNAAIAGITQYEMLSSVKLGRRYEIVNASGVQAYGFDPDDLTLEKTGSPDVTLVEGTDYTVDSAAGEVLLLSTASNIADSDAMKVTLAAGASLNTMRQTSILAREEINVSLKLLGESPRNGRRYKLWIPKCSISADGGLDLVTAQDLIGMPLMATALKRDSSTELAYLTPLPPGIS